MKKHLQFIGGVVVGVMLFGGISSIAQQYSISPNPFTVKVNGKTKPLEGYNINGSSYFKLRDIGEQVGFDVNFKDEVISIDTKTASAKPKSSEEDYKLEVVEKSNDNGLTISAKINGELYYTMGGINVLCNKLHDDNAPYRIISDFEQKTMTVSYYQYWLPDYKQSPPIDSRTGDLIYSFVADTNSDYCKLINGILYYSETFVKENILPAIEKFIAEQE